jgi:hypothetical protein
MAHKLVCLDIETPEYVYNRTIYSDYIPTPQDLAFYYNELCGYSDASVTMQVIEVPDTFNTALLTFSEERPTRFPNYDIRTTHENLDKRMKYKAYIRQMSEMEHARVALDVSETRSQPAAAAATEERDGTINAAPTRYKMRQQNWVKDLLESLESEEMPTGDELVPVEEDGFIPHAWILTPVVEIVRNDKGSRILMDHVKGKYWERLLGTTIFPDFIVSRRVSTKFWAFQHESSESLMRAMLTYYLASQDTTMVGGLSGWIPLADREIGTLINTFKRVKISEKVLSKNEDPKHIFNILGTIESQSLCSTAENPAIHPISVPAFRKYLTYVTQALNIPREQYAGLEMVNQILGRWERTSMGFRGDADPIVVAWAPMWRAVMHMRATPERLTLFLSTLDAWNPLEGHLMTLATRQEIARQWISVYIENELIVDRAAYESSVLLYGETGRWCLQFLPADEFKKQFRSERTGPEYTRLGFLKARPGHYKVVKGVKFRNPPPTMDTTGLGEDSDDKDSEESPVAEHSSRDGSKEIPKVRTNGRNKKEPKVPKVSKVLPPLGAKGPSVKVEVQKQTSPETPTINEFILNLNV